MKFMTLTKQEILRIRLLSKFYRKMILFFETIITLKFDISKTLELKMGVKKCAQSIAKSTNFQNSMKHSPFLYSRTLRYF